MSKKQSGTRKLLSGASLLAATAAIVGAIPAAHAQDNTDQQGSSDEEIVVTGSRIPAPNLTSTSPIQVVTDQEFRLSGATDTADLLQQLPQVIQLNAVDFSNTQNPLSTPGGLTTIDLRGLGPQRTLVLVNGRRLGVGDPNTGNPNPSPDIDQIPSQLIQRVEVVTGGASATYGSDAVAGVVNFIMRQDFEGFRVDAQYGWDTHTNDNSHLRSIIAASTTPGPGENTGNAPGTPAPRNVSDGESNTISVLFGANSADHNGNVTGYLTYRHANPVRHRDRDFAACQIHLPNNFYFSSDDVCQGSPNSNLWITPHGLKSVSGNNFVPFNTVATTPPAYFNSNAYEYLSRADQRYTGGLFAHYQINDSVNLYGEFSYMNDQSNVQIAPSALFLFANPLTANGGYTVNCGNPFLSASEQAAFNCTGAQIANNVVKNEIAGRRNVEGGPRQSFYEHQNYRLVFGGNGDLAPGWTYDLNASYYYTTLFQRNTGYLSFQHIDRALDVVDADPGPGVNPQCRSFVDGTDPACVPYNIFQDGGVTQAAVNYLLSPGTAYGNTSEQIAEANLVGDLGQSMGLHSPWATDGVQVALGLQYRRDVYNFLPDAAEKSGDLSGFGGAAGEINNGSFDVFELYGEARIPIIQDAPFARELSGELGYRYSDYNTAAGNVDTYKAGLQWAPTDDIRFRYSYQHAIRAPNSVELFNPAILNLTSAITSDPCAGAVPDARCAAAFPGSVGFFGTIPNCPSGQCGVLNGGNINLTPEAADTYSFGFTATPRFLPGFTGSVDYYRIRIDQVIGVFNAAVIMQQCLDTDLPVWCNQVSRSPFNGAIHGLGFIRQTGVNAGVSITQGIDVQAAYRFDIGTMGSLSASINGSWLDRVSGEAAPGLGFSDCVGLYGPTCSVTPEWRHSMRVNWETPWNVLASLQWRYISAVTTDGATTCSNSRSGTQCFVPDIPAFSYFDLSGTWDMNDHVQFRMGVNNIADKDPPLMDVYTSGTGSPNTIPTYDVLGRQWFIGVTANF